MNDRLLSLDAVRGFCMICVLGLTNWFVSFLSLFPGGADSWLAGQFTHVKWNGLAVEDLFFPTFLFVAGASFPFSLAKREARGDSRWRIARKVVARGAILVVLGMVYAGNLRLDPGKVKVVSVLGRIGVAWMLAALLFLFVRRNAVRALVGASVLVCYWAVNRNIGAPVFPDAAPFTTMGSFTGYFDRLVLTPRLMAGGLFSSEGLFGCLPAAVTALLG
ncbi:MAG: DUF5009 domain-containing protein, partial [Kiritimatiellae bacterium]|nr:DUF5009 domain-containing protein [Kiritimatiellia bacterium]